MAPRSDHQQFSIGRQGNQRLGRVLVGHHRRLHLDPSERLLQFIEQPLKELLGLATVDLLELGMVPHGYGQLLGGWFSGLADRACWQGMLGREAERGGQLLGVVGVHHLEDRLPQPCLLGRPGQRPPGAR